MIKKIFFLLLITVWFTPFSYAQLRTHTFEEVEQLSIKEPKPIVVFVHTSWCKFCKMMEHSTFKNKNVIEELNAHFYFVALDAETKKDIWFNQHRFRFKPTGTTTGIHELATALATIDNVVSYPTLTVLDSERMILFQRSSYLNAETVLFFLKQFRD